MQKIRMISPIIKMITAVLLFAVSAAAASLAIFLRKGREK